jgi:ferredoxin-NADP reductase
MNAGTLTAMLAAGVVLLATALFVAGLRRAAQGLWTAWRVAVRRRPMRLVVTGFSEHGQNFRLVLARPALTRWRPLPDFQAGMYVGLRVPAADGRVVLRRYSLAAWQRRPRRYELAIKREPNGLVSNWAGDRLRPGSSVEVTRPDGAFTWPAEPHGEVVLVAGGIGITPMRAMVHAWLGGASPCALTLVWSVRRQADLLGFHDEFESLAQARRDFRYVAVLTGPAEAWRGESGRVDAQRLLAWCQTRAPLGFWMCASVAMMDELRAGLVSRGQDPASIHQEAFGASANADTSSYTVTLQPGGQRLPFSGEPSLLTMLNGAGVPLASDCRNGTCGSCRMRLVAGSVREVIAPEWPLKEREVLACCCVPASDLTLAHA